MQEVLFRRVEIDSDIGSEIPTGLQHKEMTVLSFTKGLPIGTCMICFRIGPCCAASGITNKK